MKSLLPTLRRILRKNGYKQARVAEGFYEGMDVTVHNGCRHTTVVVEQIVVPCSIHMGNGAATTPIGTAVTEIFRRLRRSLAHRGADLSKTTLVLPGGGKLPIPKSFRDWAQRQGLQIVLITDTLPRELGQKIHDNKLRQSLPKPFVGIIDEL